MICPVCANAREITMQSQTALPFCAHSLHFVHCQVSSEIPLAIECAMMAIISYERRTK